MVVRCVAFDADDTLWDFVTAMRGGIDQAVAVVADRRLDLADRLRAVDLIDRWQRLYDAAPAVRPPGERLARLRHRSFASALADHDVHDDDLVDAMTEAYFAHRHGEIRLHREVVDLFDQLHGRYVLGLVTNGNTDPERSPLAGRFDFRLAADDIGIAKPDRRMFAMAAAAAGCHPAELVYVGDDPVKDVAAPQAVGCRGVWLNRLGVVTPPGIDPDATIVDLAELPEVLARFDRTEAAEAQAAGVGPHPAPWPVDDRLDPVLLAEGDRRNVADRYRYWCEEAIVADLDTRRHHFHVAIENWRHDRNIGAVVRNANAFGAAGVHIIGRRRWNRRGAMATDRYLPVHHHDSVDRFVDWAAGERLAVIGIDNVEGSVPIESTERCPAGPCWCSARRVPGCRPPSSTPPSRICAITQFGSTRSINAGVASGIAMHAWVRTHVP